MAFWDALRSNSGTWNGTDWSPTPGDGQRNDYSIPLYVGTPIESPVSGIVLPEHTNGGGVYSYYGKMDWGGEVDVLTFLPKYGGLVDVNMLHFDTINVKPGDVVAKGTVLGTSGGQNSGGNMPSIPRFSSGPHIGVGVHAVDNWDRMYDPKPLLSDLLAGQDTSSVPAQNQLQGSGLGWLPRGGVPAGVPLVGPYPSGHQSGGPPNASSGSQKQQTTNTCAPWDINCWLGKLGQWAINSHVAVRIGKFVLGMGMVAIGVTLFVAGAFLPDIGAAAATAAGIPEAAEPIRGALQRQKLSGSIRSGIRAEGALRNKERLGRERAAAAAENRRTAQEASDRTGNAVANAMHGFFRSSGAQGAAEAQRRRDEGLPTLEQEKAARKAERERRKAERQAAKASPAGQQPIGQRPLMQPGESLRGYFTPGPKPNIRPPREEEEEGE